MLRKSGVFRCAGGSDSLRQHIERKVYEANESMLKPLDFVGHFVPKKTHSIPMVLMLGNHSAGKSTLINTLLGKDGEPVQRTGVAPTDDGFTVIRRGTTTHEDDGPSAVTNPDFGFSDLKVFGNAFVTRFKVKTLRLDDHNPHHPDGKALPMGMMVVDTPGMIDTPVHTGHSRTSVEGQQRGYDFLKVTKYFAKRADVILLMFDPANPGTTGETLDVMKHSLMGQEHKFMILLNKVDVFDKVTDFARSYGNLAWNLAKVMRNNKDMPYIYTSYTRSHEVRVNEKSAAPLVELDKIRDEVIRELLRAPTKRLDNLLTESEEAARRVHMAAIMSNAVRSRLRGHKFPRMLAAGGLLAAAPIGISTALMTFDPFVSITLSLMGAVGCAASLRSLQQSVDLFEERLLNRLDEVFETEFRKEMGEDVKQRFTAIKGELADFLKKNGITNAPATSRANLRKLHSYTEEEVPALRKEVQTYKEATCGSL